MKIYLVSSNCSELVVRTGLDPEDFESIKNHVAEILKNTSLKLRVEGTNRYLHIDALIPGKTESDSITLASDDNVITQLRTVDTLNQRRSTIKVNELETFKGIVELYHPASDEGIRLRDWGEQDEMVLYMSDCDRHYFPLIAEAIRAMNYSWHPYDGGHSTPFQEWCEENGYDDIVGNYGW